MKTILKTAFLLVFISSCSTYADVTVQVYSVTPSENNQQATHAPDANNTHLNIETNFGTKTSTLIQLIQMSSNYFLQ